MLSTISLSSRRLSPWIIKAGTAFSSSSSTCGISRRYFSSKLTPDVKCFFDPETNTAQYVLSCPNTKKAAIIDSVLAIDLHSGRTSTALADEILHFCHNNQLNVDWILETHVHADHVTAAAYLKQELNYVPKIGISKHVTKVQNVFGKAFGMDIACNGSQFDHLFSDNETFQLGDIPVEVLETPGHTPACIAFYAAKHCVFVGDTIFMPDSGSARCDFPGGDPSKLWDSTHRILSMDEDTVLYMCHDYKADGKRSDYLWETTVKEQLEANIHLNKGITKNDFLVTRTTRDATLRAPRLIYPSLQFNLTAGFPPKKDPVAGISFVKIPVKAEWLKE